MKFNDLIDSRASYSSAHVVKVLFLLSERPMGRHKLMKEMSLGEATIKTLIKRLNKNNLIKNTTKGNVLTKKGNSFLDQILKKMSKPMEINIEKYTVGKYNFAILVKRASTKVKSGIEQRDEAIKIGADGATTLVCKNHKLIFPGCYRKATDLEKILLKHFDIKNGDVIVIGSASTKKKAYEASIIAALSLT
jgi:predicted transcriptional regulator